MNIRYFYVFIIIICILNCSNVNQPNISILSKDYFPLQVGNSLNFEVFYAAGSASTFRNDTTFLFDYTFSRMIDDNGINKYFVNWSYWYLDNNQDAIIYSDSTGVRDSTEIGILIIKNNATLGSNWKAAYGWYGTSSMIKDLNANFARIYDTTICAIKTTAIDIVTTIPSGIDSSIYTFAKNIGYVKFISYTNNGIKKKISHSENLISINK